MTAYLTIEEAQEYFDTVMNSQPWDLADNTLRSKALLCASRAIDNLAFTGYKTSSTQEHEFPRNGLTTIPQDILNACCDIANAFLDGYDPEKDFRSLRVVSQAFGQTRLTYNADARVHLAAGIPTMTAWRYLQPYLRDDQSVHVCRV